MAIGPSCSDLWTRKPKHGEWEGGEGNGPGGPSVPGVRIRPRAEASGAEHPRTFADEPSDRLVPAMCLYPSVHPSSEHHLTRPTLKRSNGSVPNQIFFESLNVFRFNMLPRMEPIIAEPSRVAWAAAPGARRIAPRAKDGGDCPPRAPKAVAPALIRVNTMSEGPHTDHDATHSIKNQPPAARGRYRRHLHGYRSLRRTDRETDLRKGAIDAAAPGRGHQCRSGEGGQCLQIRRAVPARLHHRHQHHPGAQGRQDRAPHH